MSENAGRVDYVAVQVDFQAHSLCRASGSEDTFWSLTSAFSRLSVHRFDGRVVAKLPFVPISFIQGLSHRNLAGEDYTDCSFIFLYILCTMSIRQVWSSTSSVPCPSDRYGPLHPLYHVHQTGIFLYILYMFLYMFLYILCTMSIRQVWWFFVVSELIPKLRFHCISLHWVSDLRAV